MRRDNDSLPLSLSQQRLWFLAQMMEVDEGYHISVGFRVKGSLNSAALQGALDRIVVRHEVLRTTFCSTSDEPVQRIASPGNSSFHLLQHDLRDHVHALVELERLAEVETCAPFDLERGPPIRGRLIRLFENDHALLITIHHIVADGWSLGVLLEELGILYRAFRRGEADPLPALKFQYADYVLWQLQRMPVILREQAPYWQNTLAGVATLLELPIDHPRPGRQSYAGSFVELVLDAERTAELKELSRRHRTTLFMTLLAGWAALVTRLSGQEDVVIGTPVANRRPVEIEGLIGLFVNIIALRLNLSASLTVAQFLAQVRARVIAAQQHQEIPFERVVELAQPVRNPAHSPLFQVMFVWQNTPQCSLRLPGLDLQCLKPSRRRMAQFDLMLSLREAGETIYGEIEYPTSLFEQATVERYSGYFCRLLEGMVANDNKRVECLPMLSESERHRLLYEWNTT